MKASHRRSSGRPRTDPGLYRVGLRRRIDDRRNLPGPRWDSILTNRRYYCRVFISRGLVEPARDRMLNLGLAYDL
jgi:hypothetical protein